MRHLETTPCEKKTLQTVLSTDVLLLGAVPGRVHLEIDGRSGASGLTH